MYSVVCDHYVETQLMEASKTKQDWKQSKKKTKQE